MTYAVEQDDITTITIYDNGVIYRVHTFRADIDDVELLAETLLKDAEIDKQREGEPQ